MNRPPVGRELLDQIVADAVKLLPADLLRRYQTLKVEPHLVPVRYNENPQNEHLFWVLGKSGKDLLLYDDVEEYFSTGALDRDGILREWDNIEPQDRLDGAVAELDAKGPHSE